MTSPSTEDEISRLKSSTSNNSMLSHIVTKLSSLKADKVIKIIIKFLHILNSNSIDYPALCELASRGIPDDISSLRSLIWKILFRNLSLDSAQWESDLASSRSKYASYLAEYINNSTRTKMFESAEEHPLSLEPTSNWFRYFSDIDLNEEILKDIRRTRTHMNFFFKPYKAQSSAKAPITNEQITKAAELTKNEHIPHLIKKDFITNADIMNRILFIYGRLHPDVRYVQGMNELLAPIFYCYSEDSNESNFNHIEADVFTSFENLMSEIKDIFIRSKDRTETGIETIMKRLEELIEFYDYEIYAKLKKDSIEMHFFAFKWITLFFTQDYEIFDILRLWDTIMAQDNKFECVYMMILTILKKKKSEINDNEFSGAMMVLQEISNITIYDLLNGSEDVKRELVEKVKMG